MSSLEDRAVVALRGADRGNAFVTFDELHKLSPTGVREFLEALEAEAARRGLLVEHAVVDDFTGAGVKFRWRPLA